MDTAAVMCNLDLVITSDTAAAHLAGGLGVPVWMAVSASPEWRWMYERARTIPGILRCGCFASRRKEIGRPSSRQCGPNSKRSPSGTSIGSVAVLSTSSSVIPRSGC